MDDIRPSLFINDSIQIPDYRIELWTTGINSKFVTDISSIAIGNLVVRKERNLPDELDVSLDFTQFKMRLDDEGISFDEAMSPLKNEVKIRRNFQYVFCGTIKDVILSLEENRKETIRIQALGYEDLLSKRYVTQSYGDMSYPDIAYHLLQEATHEMNWIDNMSFEATSSGDTELDGTYFAGWEFKQRTIDIDNPLPDGYIPPKLTGTDMRWNGGIRLLGGSEIRTSNLYCAPFTADDLVDNKMLIYFSISMKNTRIGQTASITCEIHMKDGTTRYVQTISVYYPNMGPWRSYGGNFTINPIYGEVDYITIYADSSYPIDICDIEVRRANSTKELTKPDPDGRDYLIDYVAGIGKAYTQSWNPYGSTVQDDLVNNSRSDYRNDRIRHYHQKSIREAIYELSILEDQNFEYYVDENKAWHIVETVGKQTNDVILEYPGHVKTVDIERNGDKVFNVAYGQGEETVPSVDSDGYQTTKRKIWSAGAMNRPSLDELVMPLTSIESYDSNIHSKEDIQLAVNSQLNIFDNVHDVPVLNLDSNYYNPSNLGLGDAVGLRISVESAFDFLSGIYRVYEYTLSVTPDFVENLSITLIEPSRVQLQNITLPKLLKNMEDDIKTIGIQRTS